MKSKTWDETILANHRSSIKQDAARDAFDAMVAAAIDIPEYATEPAWQGEVRIFKYVDPASGERPFAFIVNRRDLLFYVRVKGIKRVRGGFGAFKRGFDTAAENKRGEWTVRVATAEDAKRLNSLLFSRRSISRVLSTDKAWRTNSKAAGEMLEDILSTLPTEMRKGSISILQEAVGFAKSRFPDRWVLTLQPNRVRFICGMVMNLQFTKSSRSTVLLLKRLAPPRLRKNGGEYALAPGCVEAYLSSRELVARYPTLRSASQAAMLISAAAHGGSGGHRRAHSRGLVTYLEGMLEDTVGANGGHLIGPLFGDEMEMELEVLQRADLSETDKQAIIKARRGQGLFRERVAAAERFCRVTGIDDPEHLRAGHIKPWRVSTNSERLSGENGLLLAPHVDHLFDRGFISFTDVGDILVSPQCRAAVLTAWGISTNVNVGPFRLAQRPFLAYHREHVFLR